MRIEYVHSFGEKQLLFGLSWQSIVGQLQPPQLKQLLKKRQANHWVVAGHTFTALGCKHKRITLKKELYSAAVCYALLFPRGLHAAIYKINDTLYWLTGCQEGTPMSRADVLFADAESAGAALEQLTQQYADLHVSASFEELSDFFALIAARSLQKAEMQTLKKLSWHPVALVIACAGALVWWQFIEPGRVEAAAVEPEIDPYLHYWESRQIQPNGTDALLQVLQHWEQLPLRLAAWQLQDSHCVAERAVWQCSHRYAALTDMATAAGLEAALPTGWAIQEVSLQQAQLQSEVTFINGQHRWRSGAEIRTGLLSRLQHIRSAFQSLRLGEPANLAPGISAPTYYAPIYSQSLQFEGPLRSAALLTHLEEALHWQKAVLSYRAETQPSLKNSALQISLQGVIYVRNE